MNPEPSAQDYNLCSQERRSLLEALNTHLDGREVSPAFWAACQLADIESLRLMRTIPIGFLLLGNSNTFDIRYNV